ncbi:TIGR02677 family protein [Listeria newyorkensis]|uniref:TIGR02677 family protein n=1 Tax=Listeria newyorkensis TaxID=1497681 RepID=A0ABX4XQF2_9LIST|nr:TIGR02677 family protein [Listeria newyorkensis]PNP93812.1 TIGR02677 family protein [Listeria newyorkensis]
MNNQDFSKLSEATYVTAENYKRYRLIMRYFYDQHRSMNDLLYRGDILKFMQEDIKFPNYQEKELDQDLNSLISWGNLEQRQEMSQPKSIEEYKNRHFRYQISETSVVIEDMLENIANLHKGTRGSLDKNIFERLLVCLTRLEKETPEGQQLLDIWEDTVTHFSRISKNTTDYIGYLNSEKSELQMQTEVFLVYRDKFINYLRDFIIAMQNKAYQIQHSFENVSEACLERIFQQILKKEKEIPRLEILTIDENQIRKEFFEKWNNMKSWFIDQPHKASEYSLLLNQTNHAIRKMTHLMQRFSDQMQQYHSRKKDYMLLAKWFLDCENLDEANELSAYLFGFEKTKHYYVKPCSSDNKYEDMWEIDPTIHETVPRIRSYSRKTKSDSFERKQAEKDELRNKHLRENKQLENGILSYIKDNKIDLKDVGFVEKVVRKILLKWLSLSFQKEDNIIQTEFNMSIKITVDTAEIITLCSEDGELTMPRVVYNILKKEIS